jgi:hypothetical protein
MRIVFFEGCDDFEGCGADAGATTGAAFVVNGLVGWSFAVTGSTGAAGVATGVGVGDTGGTSSAGAAGVSIGA